MGYFCGLFFGGPVVTSARAGRTWRRLAHGHNALLWVECSSTVDYGCFVCVCLCVGVGNLGLEFAHSFVVAL